MSIKQKYGITAEDVVEASARIQAFVHRTPIITCSTLNRLAGKQIFFKCEIFQKTGSFKARGACNAVLGLAPSVSAVVTHSSGNFGQALAYAAQARSLNAFVVMPRGASSKKREAAEGYGAYVLECEPNLEARERTARKVAEESRAVLVHPYDQAEVIAGQGTIALEVLEEVPSVEAIVAPIGGGGLISGIAVAARSLAPHIKVIAAEPIGADDAARSKAAGVFIPQVSPNTIADGLRTSLGQLTWPIVRDLVDEVVTVSDAEIIFAMRVVFERMKIVIEPSAAVAVAAVLCGRSSSLHGLDKVAVVLSGGNTEPSKFFGPTNA